MSKADTIKAADFKQEDRIDYMHLSNNNSKFVNMGNSSFKGFSVEPRHWPDP